MSFQDAVDNWCSEHSGQELAELVGCNPSSISDYRDGAEPKPERKQKIIEIIGYKEEPEKDFNQEIQYVPLKEAAARLGLTEYNLKNALRVKDHPLVKSFNMSFQGSGKAYNYFILRADFEEFIEKHKWPQ